MATKWVYFFGEGKKEDKFLLGGKGANLSEMTNLGLPIPQGYTISAPCCIAWQAGKCWPTGLKEQDGLALQKLEAISGKKFGDAKDPLLLSVRSGAAVSLPGMMDTVLNLGLTDENVEALAKKSNRRFAYDSYRRFIQMFSDVVMDVSRHNFEHVLDQAKSRRGAKFDNQLTADDLAWVVAEYKKVFKKHTGKDFPQDPRAQLTAAISAVFGSWNNTRAIAYRNLNRIDHNMGTAVNVQQMVFGNMGDDCATGVAFTRNPSTGENARYGEYLMNAQGEDVVAGIRTPKSIHTMKNEVPEAYDQLMKIFEQLELHYRNMQDIEFTIQNYKLYILQTRNGKRTAQAAVKMAVDMVKEGLITKEEGIMRVTPAQIDALLHKQLDPKAIKKAVTITKGLPASPGAGVGQVVFSAERAVELSESGQKVVLVRQETSPEDISGMAVAQGILTQRGGMTSHAAVVARGMNTCCVAGCSDISVDESAKTFSVGGKTLKEGDWISLDGSSGKVYIGKVPVIDPEMAGEFSDLLSYADEIRQLQVHANADTPHDAQVALDFGAQGIGLCRTEHMFFAPERISAVRQMILADDTAGRKKALAKILPFQRQDFHGLMKVMTGKDVIIRLIDPPLHEFLPHEEKEQAGVAKELGVATQVITDKVKSLHEFNPMLGFRGCRLGMVYPEINEMQARAVFQAALALVKEGKDPRPLIEVPLVGNLKEFRKIEKMVRAVAKEEGAQGIVKYQVGTMIEVPRAALTADELAAHCDFMSFGTNDLTQMTCGFSRDDSGVFLKEYVKQGIYKDSPFVSLDQHGVGKLMHLCVDLARQTKPHIDIGICGEHGGDPASVEFCHKIRMNTVSCSPYRVPVARLAAAQAVVKFGSNGTIPDQAKSAQALFFTRSRL